MVVVVVIVVVVIVVVITQLPRLEEEPKQFTRLIIADLALLVDYS